MLFPLIFLIFPAMFVVLLLPAIDLESGSLLSVDGVTCAPARNADAAPRGRADRRCESVTVADWTSGACAACSAAGPAVGSGSRAAAGLVDPHGVHALPDRRRLPRRGAGRDQDRGEPTPVQDRVCRGAREVVELRAGECERAGSRLGDRVAWASRSRRSTRRSQRRTSRRAADVERRARSRRERRPALRQARRGSSSRQGHRRRRDVPSVRRRRRCRRSRPPTSS